MVYIISYIPCHADIFQIFLINTENGFKIIHLKQLEKIHTNKEKYPQICQKHPWGTQATDWKPLAYFNSYLL